ncbi:MAG TPA: TIGR02300 family protein [Candidatus Sulfotelmatobacter sp.]|nr:TIGR02300 family protein [Candidatus Sulfotelmatobacter sp.]
MAKPEWGTKRRCTSCGTVFYDLKKDPIICPHCAAVHQPELLLKPRRGRPEEKAPAKQKPVPEEVVVVATDDAAEEEDFIEDASELGEDEDDVAEVIEGADEEPVADER